MTLKLCMCWYWQLSDSVYSLLISGDNRRASPKCNKPSTFCRRRSLFSWGINSNFLFYKKKNTVVEKMSKIFAVCYPFIKTSKTLLIIILIMSLFLMGTAVAQWLRCCATNRKVAGSMPACVIGIFHWHKNPSDRTMALGSTQPLTEMSTRSISWG